MQIKFHLGGFRLHSDIFFVPLHPREKHERLKGRKCDNQKR